MTKELALMLMNSKEVYLTKEGRQLLEQLVKKMTSHE